ncbi:MAG: hypothetical protein CMN30_21845 [Sandaracinus sp.]|nr:hypothetical protein [Sandaracinus sp.]|tara:strand:- start:625 stop:1080 length:456 start_codon:yes stop_codon:yes gene_type:complete
MEAATTRLETTLPFRCGHCGLEAEAQVRTAASHEGSGDGALDRAEGRAWDLAVRTVALAPCPSCGRRDTHALRRWWGERLLGALMGSALTGGLAAVGLFLLRQEADGWVPLMGLGAAAVAFVALLAAATFARSAATATVAIPPQRGASRDG